MKPVSPVIPAYVAEEVTYAADQPEYIPLPVLRIGDPAEGQGVLLTRWRMSWRERFRALFFGDVYCQVMTFGQPLQPIAISVDVPVESE